VRADLAGWPPVPQTTIALSRAARQPQRIIPEPGWSTPRLSDHPAFLAVLTILR
jgi:hypothetical protein